MRAVVIRAHGSVEELRLEDRPLPEPGPGEVRVALRAAGLSHLDLWVRRGVPGVSYDLPRIPGNDGAGVVDAVGPGVTEPVAGDAVLLCSGAGCGSCLRCVRGQENCCSRYRLLGAQRDGTCAEAVVVAARHALPIPTGLSFVEAATLGQSFLTAWHLLVTRARVEKYETVLVQGAGSGVGMAAVQVARWRGARVVAVAGSETRRALAERLGASRVLDSRHPKLAQEIHQATRKRGVDVVVDSVGEATLPTSLASLTHGGRLVVCGATSGFELRTDLRHLFRKNLSILGSTMGTLGELHTVLGCFARGELEPVVGRVLPLADVAEAHQLLERREVAGKLALRVHEEKQP